MRSWKKIDIMKMVNVIESTDLIVNISAHWDSQTSFSTSGYHY